MAHYIYGCCVSLIFIFAFGQVSAWKEKKWDELIFTQQWSPASCLQASLQKIHHCVIPGNVTTWTVHGIWPTEGGTYGPNYCNKTDKFNPAKLKPIRDLLVKYWPNLYTEEGPDSFWEHEWTKHGTCAEQLPDMDSELKYFSKGLKLNRLYDLQVILEKAGISPDSNKLYKLTDITKATTSTLGYSPKHQCFLSQDKAHQTLLQMEICLDRDFSVIECKKKGDSNQILNYTPSKHQRPRKSINSLPAQTETCLENVPVLYLPFQR